VVARRDASLVIPLPMRAVAPTPNWPTFGSVRRGRRTGPGRPSILVVRTVGRAPRDMACAAGTPRTSGQDCPARGRAGGRLATSEVVFAFQDSAPSFCGRPHVCQRGHPSPGLLRLDHRAGAKAFPFVLQRLYTRPVPSIVPLDLRARRVTLNGAAEVGLAVSGTIDDTLRVALLDGSSVRYVELWTGALGTMPRRRCPPGPRPRCTRWR
jgi:hypothetical protein